MSSQYPILEDRPIDQWKVAELREELKRRKLATKGLKEELVKRLHESILSETKDHKDSELENGVNSSFFQKDTNDDCDQGGTDPVGDSQLEDSVEFAGTEINQTNAEPANVDDHNNHPDISMHDQVDGLIADSFEVNKNQPDSDTTLVEHDGANIRPHENDSHKENPMSTDELISSAEAVIPSEASVQNDFQNEDIILSSKTEQESVCFQKNATPEFITESPFEPSEPKNLVPDVNLSSGSHSPTYIDPEIQEDLVQDQPDNNTEPLSEDVVLEQVEQNNQVSEFEPNLGFQVSSESISSDSVSINKKNELKDNLNANDFPLELEVFKQDMVHPSSSDNAPVGELQPLDPVLEPGVDLGLLEEMDVIEIAKDDSIGKKIDIADAAYTEKLTLDRSSGEESMEEDVLETKQIDSHMRPNEEEDEKNVNKLHKEESCLDAGSSRSILENSIIKEESTTIVSIEKRKLEGSEIAARANEPSKRQRRWSSESLKVPDHSPSTLPTSITPKASVLPSPKHPFARSDSVVGGDSPKERIVPPSQRSPSTSLRIDRFLRPFTLKQVHELLGKTGTVCSFWMDNIKTHCYVTYSSEEEATATRNALYNLQWPVNGGRFLVAEFVDPDEVKLRIEAPPEAPAAIIPSPRTPSAASQAHASQLPFRQHGPKQQLPPPPPLPSPLALVDQPMVVERQQLPLPPPPRKRPEPPKPELPILTLDDLFVKTKTTPRIYYLPLSEEQVSAKHSAQAKVGGN